MPFVSNPLVEAPDISHEYPEWPTKVKGGHWFDDFTRPVYNPANSQWRYSTYPTGGGFVIDTDGQTALRELRNTGDGINRSFILSGGQALWKYDFGQSPYAPPAGVVLECWGLEINGNSSGATFGLSDVARQEVDPNFDSMFIDIDNNIVGQQNGLADQRTNNGKTTFDLFAGQFNTTYDISIEYRPGDSVKYSVKANRNNAVYGTTFGANTFGSESFTMYLMGHAVSDQSSIRLPRWGVRYL